jgi:hypothetical protein
MTTKQEAIAALKQKNPTLKMGDDERGYTDLSLADYEATIEAWADDLLAEQAKAEAEANAEADKLAAQAKLLALGLTEADLIAMGLMPKPIEPA